MISNKLNFQVLVKVKRKVKVKVELNMWIRANNHHPLMKGQEDFDRSNLSI